VGLQFTVHNARGPLRIPPTSAGAQLKRSNARARKAG
jgi:hypothetical protein